jgi:hypothetical protein
MRGDKGSEIAKRSGKAANKVDLCSFKPSLSRHTDNVFLVHSCPLALIAAARFSQAWFQ